MIKKKLLFTTKTHGYLRRNFTPEFKEEVLSKVKDGEDSVSAIARNYGGTRLVSVSFFKKLS